MERKQANEWTTGSSPASAIAPACETMSCSAMPHSKKRSGIALAELDEAAVEAEVGVEGDEPGLALRLLDERLAVGGTSRCRVARGRAMLGRLGLDELDRLGAEPPRAAR